jgi:hypothetical protein
LNRRKSWRMLGTFEYRFTKNTIPTSNAVDINKSQTRGV